MAAGARRCASHWRERPKSLQRAAIPPSVDHDIVPSTVSRRGEWGPACAQSAIHRLGACQRFTRQTWLRRASSREDLRAVAQPSNSIADCGVSCSVDAFEVDEQRSGDGRYDERHGSCKGTLQDKAPPPWELPQAAKGARINNGWGHGSWSSNIEANSRWPIAAGESFLRGYAARANLCRRTRVRSERRPTGIDAA